MFPLRRVYIKVIGIVQGVGFRPFVYNSAVSLKLKGWVKNNSEGVFMDLEGDEKSLNMFIDNLRGNPPPLSRIEKIELEDMETINYLCFEIKNSDTSEDKITLISPDIAVCKDCIREIQDNNNKRCKYPFTNCTNCGPRFSIIKSIPYDRDKTTMKKFLMCKFCTMEYKNPADRRFHAQPNSCPECGPELWLEDIYGKIENVLNPIGFVREKLKEGKIFAVKGIGGFHLVCDAENSEAVRSLRERKKRKYKPFAIMLKDMDVVKKYCIVTEKEEEILSGIRKPIVILQKNPSIHFPEEIAPKQKNIGVMFPYTPLHILLFDNELEALVMTSANGYGLPIEYENESAKKKLKDIADYYLFHNRDIHIPVDDSVVKVIKGKMRIIRRARGFVPEPIIVNNIKPILAVGSNMKNTFCIAKENFLILSQHNGDLDNVETYENFIRNIEHFKNIFQFSPQFIACDMHPDYLSSAYASESKLEKIQVQHHHAHIVSCMVENKLKEKVIGVAFDGTGYGIDGAIWGGEFLICDYRSFERIGHFQYVIMPGGDKAVKESWRMAVSYIYEAFKCEGEGKVKSIIEKLYGDKGLNIIKVLKSGINCPKTSSMGRFFDAMSSIFGICHESDYEGQAAIELEAALELKISANEEIDISYPYEIRGEENFIVDASKAIKKIVEEKIILNKIEKGPLKIHNTIVHIIVDMCKKIRNKVHINKVALSGGVFQNSYLLRKAIDELTKNDFLVYTHKEIPCNDGGLSLGQIAVANEFIESSNF